MDEKNKLKVAYIGFDIFVDALYAFENNNCKILKIFTCETDNFTEFNIKVVKYAKEKNIPLQKSIITKQDIIELEKQNCDLIFSAGYYHKIPFDTKIPMINVHPSLLPEGRGAWPMPILIMNGARKTGVTFHKIVDKFDAGDIVLQSEIEVDENENLETLTRKFCDVVPSMVKKLCENFPEIYFDAVEQNLKAYNKSFFEEDCPITAEMNAVEADKILRAFYGYECIYFKNDKKYGLVKGKVQAEKTEFPLKDAYVLPESVREL